MQSDTRQDIMRRRRVAIDVMRRVVEKDYRFDMSCWSDSDDDPLTEREAVECGTTACFAGWLALSPEAQQEGIVFDGLPLFRDYYAHEAIALFLGITELSAADLCYRKGETKAEEILRVLEDHILNAPIEANAAALARDEPANWCTITDTQSLKNVR